MPSLLFILFVVAVASILFLSDLELSPFASPPTSAAADHGNGVYKQHNHHEDHGSSGPQQKQHEVPLVQGSGGGAEMGLSADNILITNITNLRRGLAENYIIE